MMSGVESACRASAVEITSPKLLAVRRDDADQVCYITGPMCVAIQSALSDSSLVSCRPRSAGNLKFLGMYPHEMFQCSGCVVRQRILVHETVLEVFGLFPNFFCVEVHRPPRILRSVFGPRSTEMRMRLGDHFRISFRIQYLGWFDSGYSSHVSSVGLGNNFTHFST